MRTDYERYMRKCFELANAGLGNVSPNPLVGCVVIDKNGNEISTGYHSGYGEIHAERDALNKISKEEAEGGTLIVNLEPCSHQGQTPPCTDIIIEKGIKTVVYGVDDPNPIASGGGEILKNAGIKVIKNVLKKESIEINEIFFKTVTLHTPFIAIKTATTIDGKIATISGDSKWITSESARSKGKELRKRYDAIMTTATTVLADNPNMVAKTKIIIDRTLKSLNYDYSIFKQGQIYIVTDENNQIPEHSENIKIIKLPFVNNQLNLNNLFDILYGHKIMSIFIESGSKFSGSVIKQNLADKIYHFIAPKILNDNSAKSCFDGDEVTLIKESKRFKINSVELISPDILITYTRV